MCSCDFCAAAGVALVVYFVVKWMMRRLGLEGSVYRIPYIV